MHKTILLISLLITLVSADIQFISSVNDFNLNCSVRTTAGTMVALITTPQVNSGSFQIARLDTSGSEVNIFLLNNATYNNIYSSTFTVDAVLKRVMVMTEISGQQHLLIYSTLNGSLLNDIIPDRTLFMFAVDLYDSTIYALTVIQNFVYLGSLNTNTGAFTALVNTTTTGAQSPSQSIDFIKRVYLFFGSNGDAYKINLVTLELSITSVFISNASPISLYNDLLYMFISEGAGGAIKWKLGTLNVNDTNTAYLSNASFVFGFIAIPRAFDFANLKLYTPLADSSVIYTYNMSDGSTLHTSTMPSGYTIAASTFEQECICCLQAEPASSKRFSLEILNMRMQAVPGLENCQNSLTSSAVKPEFKEYMMVFILGNIIGFVTINDLDLFNIASLVQSF